MHSIRSYSRALGWLLLGLFCLPRSEAQISASAPARGLTFSIALEDQAPLQSNIAHAACLGGGPASVQCNPHIGDTLCSAALPVLCIWDIDALAPEGLAQSEYWTGGILGASIALPGLDLKTLSDANAICRGQFGPQWRIANFHDGGGWAVTGYGNLRAGQAEGAAPSKVWIDNREQPRATCWAR